MRPETSEFPFVGLLTELRERGFGVGLREFKDVATLAERWQGVDRNSFRDAIAALIARDAEEVAQIRIAFDEWADTDLVPPKDPPPPEPKRVSRVRPWHIAALVLLLISGGVVFVKRRIDVERAKKPPDVKVPDDTGYRPPVETPTVPEPQLPRPPREPAREVPVLAGVIALAIALLFLAARRAKSRQSDWLRRYWRHFLEKKPGPHHYDYRVRPIAPPLPRVDIEDVATILGRAQEIDVRTGDKLDVDASLRLTLREGMRPHLVFEPPPRNVPVIVLQDVGWQMRPWQSKIDYFLEELIRQGILIERWFFEGDPLLVSRAPRDGVVSLASLTARQSDASLMILSTGQSITSASLDELERLLSKWMFRTWINPIGNPSYWRRELDRLPVRAWPMTRAGVRAAAMEISRKRASDASPAGVSRRAVTRADVERMQQLIALVPHPSLELAEELRRRFCRDVPEEVLLFLGAEGVFYGETIRFPPEQLKRLLAESPDPARDRAVRMYLLEVLRESEPPAESVAHLRWQIDQAIHRLEIGEESDARETLRQLAQGPLADEVQTALALVDEKKVEPAARAAAQTLPDELPEPPSELLGRRPPLFAWPSWKAAVVLVIVIGGATLLAASLLPLGEGDPIPHQVGAYEFKRGPQVDVYVARAVDKNAPREARIYRNGNVWRPVTIAPQPYIPIPQKDRGAWFEIRAALPKGNLAVSRPVWVPGVSQEELPAWVDDWIADRVVRALAQRLNLPAASIKPDAPLAGLTGAYGESALDDIRAILLQQLSYGAPLSDLNALDTVTELADYYRARTPNALVTLTFTNESGVVLPGIGYTLQSESLAARGTAGTPLVVRPALYAVEVDGNTVGTIDPDRAQSLTQQFVVKAPEGTLQITELPPNVPVRNLRIGRPRDVLAVTGPTMRLPPGRYNLALEDDFHSWRRPFTITANQTTVVKVDARPTYGTATIAMPGGVASQIRRGISGSSLRETSSGMWILRARPGKYRVPVIAQGQNWVAELDIEPGKQGLATLGLPSDGPGEQCRNAIDQFTESRITVAFCAGTPIPRTGDVVTIETKEGRFDVRVTQTGIMVLGVTSINVTFVDEGNVDQNLSMLWRAGQVTVRFGSSSFEADVRRPATGD